MTYVEITVLAVVGLASAAATLALGAGVYLIARTIGLI